MLKYPSGGMGWELNFMHENQPPSYSDGNKQTYKKFQIIVRYFLLPLVLYQVQFSINDNLNYPGKQVFFLFFK